MRRELAAALISTATALTTVGCQSGTREGQALSPQAFYTPSPASVQHAPTTSPSSPGTGADATTPALPDALAPAPSPSANTSIADPAPSPDPGISTGSYMVVGTVLAVANGRPIYADKVLAMVDRALAEKARELAPADFRVEAANIIRQAVELEVRSELEFAAAQRNTDDEEKRMASLLTTQWRQNEITRAGGSLAVARRKALEDDGVDFDEKVNDRHRWYLVMLYYEKHVFPRAKVAADDIRRYYDQNIELFTEKAAVQFRLFKAPYRNDAADQKRALTKAQAVHEKAKSGHDFAELARENTDPILAKNAGFPLMEKDKDGRPRGAFIEKGTLTIEQVEKAVFALNVGEITEIIDERNAYYVAKLEARKVGRVHPFDEISVQEAITSKLRSDERLRLREKEAMKLLRSSVWSTQDRNYQTAVDMAMQKYPIWRREKPAQVSSTR